jgi:hypothetical protein
MLSLVDAHHRLFVIPASSLEQLHLLLVLSNKLLVILRHFTFFYREQLLLEWKMLTLCNPVFGCFLGLINFV